MSQKDIQDYLDKGLYGAPQLKPDEQRKYLGTFRERVVFGASLQESCDTCYDTFYATQLEKYPDGTLLINACCDMATQNRLMKLAQDKHVSFRLVDSETDEVLSANSLAVVYALKKAINIVDISPKVKKLSATYNKKESPQEKPKVSFFKSWFK